jgi:oligopeptidase A
MKFSQSKPLYEALLKVQKGWEEEGKEDGGDDDFAAAQRRRAVENSLRSMKLGGVGFEEGSPEQVRYKEIKMRQAELSTAFSNNAMDATKAFGLAVMNPADVAGVPESAIAMWAQAYQQHAIKECKDDEEKKVLEEAKVDASAGPWRITLDGPSYIAAMQHLPNRELRREVYVGYMTRASEFTADILEKMDEEKKKDVVVDEKEKKDKPGKNNVPIIKEILKNKKELSGLLGFSNYAGECSSPCV